MASTEFRQVLKNGALKVASEADRLLSIPDNWAMKSDSGYRECLIATNAFLKFCVEHSALESGRLREFLEALEQPDYEKTKRLFKSLGRVAHGTFDWIPPVVFDHETQEYVDVVFVSLYKNWYQHVAGLLELGKDPFSPA